MNCDIQKSSKNNEKIFDDILDKAFLNRFS